MDEKEKQAIVEFIEAAIKKEDIALAADWGRSWDRRNWLRHLLDEAKAL